MQIDQDSLNFVNDQDVADCCIHIMDRIQGFKPAVQIQAITAMFRLLAEILELDVRECIAQVERIMQDNADTRYWDYRFSAVKEYIRGEIKKHES